jgi:hypothetical protein
MPPMEMPYFRVCIAYSGPNRPPVPMQIGHPFRSKPATVPEHSGHPCFLGLSRSY